MTGIDHNVAIIGGGQTGCALAFALRRAGVGKVTILEAAPDEQRAGIWLNAARMNLLRTPKTLPGPELGIPALSFQAWYEARHGQAAYAAIDRIRAHRLGGLSELVQALSRHQPALRHAAGADRARPAIIFTLHLDTPEGSDDGDRAQDHPGDRIRRRRRQLHPGRAGRAICRAARYAHTEDTIDFAALRGKVVGVDRRGGRPPSTQPAWRWNMARHEVHLFARRDTIAAVPITRSRGFPGAYDNYHQLPDADRWHQAIRFFDSGSTPTTDAIERTVKFRNFHLHLSAPWTNAAMHATGRSETTIDGMRLIGWISLSPAPGIPPIWRRGRNCAISPARSCYGATSIRRCRGTGRDGWAAILTSVPDTS